MGIVIAGIVIFNVIYMLAVERFMGVFFEKQRTPAVVMWLSYLLYFILAGVERLVSNAMVTHVLFVIPLLFIISLNYESSMIKRLAAIISNYAVFAVAVLLVFIPAYLFDFEHLHVLEYSVGSLIALLIATYLRRLKKIRQTHISSPLFLTLALVVPCPVIIALIIHSMGFYELALVFSFVFLMGINIFIFFVYENLSAAHEEKQRQKLDAQEKEYYFAQCQLMEESVEKMNSYRHDIKLHLAVLKDYTADNKAAGDYLNSLLGDLGESEIYSNTGNIAFDSIINFKLKNAKEDNIKLDVTLFVPPAINVEVSDIVTILGNLLDNALDAVAKVEEKSIKLNVKFSKGNLYIGIDNTFDGEIKYNDSAGKVGNIGKGENRIATRKGGGDSGHGLKNIMKSVDKYNGQLDITHTDNVFSAAVLLYVADH